MGRTVSSGVARDRKWNYNLEELPESLLEHFRVVYGILRNQCVVLSVRQKS